MSTSAFNEISGTAAAEALNGPDGESDDWIKAGDGDDTVQGHAGSDSLQGEGGDDLLYGDDSLGGTGASGADTLDGGAGNDTLSGSNGRDTFIASAGHDVILDYQPTLGEPIDLGRTWNVQNLGQLDVYETRIIDGVSGLYLEEAGNSLFIRGLDRATLSMNEWWLTLAPTDTGSAWRDWMEGTAGNDTLDGGAGDDWFKATLGNDSIIGGTGKNPDGHGDWDSVHYDSTDFAAIAINMTDATVAKTASAEATVPGGTDTIAGVSSAFGTVGNDSLTGTPAQSLTGDANVSFSFDPSRGDDTIIGGTATAGDGRDTLGRPLVEVSYYSSETGISADLTAERVELGTAGEVDTVQDVNITGSRFNDTIVGSDHAESLRGDVGDDSISAGAGDDQLHGGVGNDTLDGGDGLDELALWGAFESVVVDLSANTVLDGQGGTDTVSNVERVWASENNDTVIGTTAAESIGGSGGDDFLDAGGGRDELDGGSGNDTMIGGDGADFLSGRDGDDSLDGGAGDDRLRPGAGSDTIDGGAGVDRLDYNDLGVGVTIRVTGSDGLSGTVSKDGGAMDTFSNIERFYGTRTADVIAGGAGTQKIRGRGGDDTLSGGPGSDRFDLNGWDPVGGVATITDLHDNDRLLFWYSDVVLDPDADVQADHRRVVLVDLALSDDPDARLTVGQVGVQQDAAAGITLLTMKGHVEEDGNTTGLWGFRVNGLYDAADFAVQADGVSVVNTAAPSEPTTTPTPDPTPTPTPDPTPTPVPNPGDGGGDGDGGDAPAPAPQRPTRVEDVPVEMPDIPEGGTGRVDLGSSRGMTAEVPAGVGLEVRSSRAPVTAENARGELTSLVARAKGNLDDQKLPMNSTVRAIDLFVDTVARDKPVEVMSIKPTVTTGGLAAGPITIGSSSDDEDAMEAVVLDVTALPTGTVINIENVEFVSIIGNTTIGGGAGANFVVGDEGMQVIVCGEDDDELHGGAGDDTVGSRGGDDKLYGDEGDDIVFGGDGRDSLWGGEGDDVLRGDAGIDTVHFDTSLSDMRFFLKDETIVALDTTGAEGRDTLETIERGSFAGTEVDLAFTSADPQSVAAVAALYHGVLDRAADLGGLNYWMEKVEQAGIGLVAEAFTHTAEFGETVGGGLTDRDFTEAVYQHVLGRTADTDGAAYWLARLAEGAGRGEVVASFALSAEHSGMITTDDGIWLV